MSAAMAPWVVVMVAAAATYLWRGLGALLAARIDPEGALFRWVSCISYALLAALVARIVVLPMGEMAATQLADRLLALAAAVAAFLALRRRVLPAALIGAAAFAGIVSLSS